ncbi:MAG: putative DNA binding domain-containing protein [Deltaproteobacteria bacterium]|nr:putative DNA binding domain-containing protein [Deltaproteobacteria bacterium]
MKVLFSEAELRALLQRDEGQFLEFKSLWDLDRTPPKVLDRRKVRDAIAEYIAAFANADGGTLVLGVDDDGVVSGHGYPEEALRDFLAVSEKRLRPPLRVRLQRVVLDRQELLIIAVGIAPEAVMVEGNGFPYRVGDVVIREPQEVINERKQAYRRVGYEQRIRPEAVLTDLDLDLAHTFLGRTVHKGRPVEELLAQYGLVLPRAGEPGVTNAALLLFGKTPLTRWHPRAGIRFFRVAGTERRHGAQRNVTQLYRIEAPLAAAIPAAHHFAATQIRRSEKLHDLFFREMPEYPTFAWQEAIVNAVAHRDYGDQGREIEIWFFDDRLEVLSPGDLVVPVTLEHLRARRRIHASRNPLLVRVLVEAGIMREEGEGIPRIFEEMEESSLRQPEFVVEDAEFRVTLWNEPSVLGLPAEPAWRVERASRLRAYFKTQQTLTNSDYQELFEVTRYTAARELRRLVDERLLSRVGERRGAHYLPGPGLSGGNEK